MIQRVQTIWLFLAALALILMLFLPIATKDLSGHKSTIYITGVAQNFIGSGNTVEPNLPLIITNIAVAVMCFANIFNFKRRSLQKRVAILNIIFIGGFAFWCSIYAQKVPGGIDGATFGVGAYIPAIAILFIVLAIFGINKDERLIRSAERLR